MKLNDLLEEVKVGSEAYEEQQTTEQLMETFDEDIDNYRISNVLKAMINKLSENLNEDTKGTVSTLRKAQNKIAMYEDKMEKASVSKAYARMKLDSLTEDYNRLVESISSKKVQRQLDQDAFAHALGLLQFEQKQLADQAEIEEVNRKELPETFQPVVEKEYKIISEAIS